MILNKRPPDGFSLLQPPLFSAERDSLERSTHRIKAVTPSPVTAPPLLLTPSVPQLEPSPNLGVQNPPPLKSFRDTLVAGSVSPTHPLVS
ncbi:hypothetical protein SLE2022_275410 [Rubroshorea leprosula]